MTGTIPLEKAGHRKLSTAAQDLIVLAASVIIVFILSYFFNLFSFLVTLTKKQPSLLPFIDEIISILITSVIGFSIFSWRRWWELKEETAKRMKLQEEIVALANTKADTERIIAKQLRSELEYHKKIEAELLQLAHHHNNIHH